MGSGSRRSLLPGLHFSCLFRACVCRTVGRSFLVGFYQEGLNDNMPDLLALELAYGGGGKAKKASHVFVASRLEAIAIRPSQSVEQRRW